MAAIADSIPAVSRFEQRLIQITRSLLGFGSTDSLGTWLAQKHVAPPCLSPVTVQLVQETLSKGIVRRLAELGSRSERFVSGGQVVAGTLWERVPMERRALHFSRNVLAWLRWAVEHNVIDPPSMPDVEEPSLTLADRLFFAFAAQSLAKLGVGLVQNVMRNPVFCRNGLVWLEHHQLLTRCRVLGKPDFRRWFSPKNQWALEAWQTPLSEAWIDSTFACSNETDIGDLRRVGEAIERLAEDFSEAATAAERRDLGRFWLVAAWSVASRGGFESDRWFAKMSLAALAMHQRQTLYWAGLAIPRIVSERLTAWNRDARNIGYLDDGYVASQLFKSDWERLAGDSVVRQLGPLFQRFPMAVPDEGH
jgi:hypothetical protein